MKTQGINSRKDGAVLGVVLVVMLVVIILTLILFRLGRYSAVESVYQQKSTQAFWVAEAGARECVARRIKGVNGEIASLLVGGGTGTVTHVDTVDSPAEPYHEIYESVGSVPAGGEPVSRRVRIKIYFGADPLDNVIFSAAGKDRSTGTQETTLVMNGNKMDKDGNSVEGPPEPESRGNFWGGNDIAEGNVKINGGVLLDDQSEVKAIPGTNPFGVESNVECHEGEFYGDDARVDGEVLVSTPSDFDPPNLGDMHYEINHTVNVAEEFRIAEEAGLVQNGMLPEGHYLRDIVRKNDNGDSDVSNLAGSTDGDDYFFQPVDMSLGTPSTAASQISLGNEVYYVEGHVWFRSFDTYGFEVDGQSVIVSTEDIHIGDNIEYANKTRDEDEGDILALIALGNLYDTGHYKDSGDFYFGDPDTGTLYICDAFMFANNNFYYNTSMDGADWSKQQPESGFKVFGNFMAMNEVIVKRDWYRNDDDGKYYPAEYAQITNSDGTQEWVWVDSKDWADGTASRLSGQEIGSIRHYAMQVTYDDRLLDMAVNMNGMPLGRGSFVARYTWEEIPPQ